MLMKPKLLTAARESHVMSSEKESEVEPVRACLVFRDNSHHSLYNNFLWKQPQILS